MDYQMLLVDTHTILNELESDENEEIRQLFLGTSLLDEERCYDYICRKLKINKKQRHNGVRKDRAPHTVLTYLLGKKLGVLGNLLDCCNITNGEFEVDELWLLTALVHDYGYLIKATEEGPDLNKLVGKYNLLTDEYSENNLRCLNSYAQSYSQYITYSYDEIIKYYYWKRKYYIDQREKGDHGIVGGCKLFSMYAREADKQGVALGFSPQLYKTVCLMAAQHNIFKSDNTESDEQYYEFGLKRLVSSRGPVINRGNGLLMLLSLVDTIEFTKRFSKKKNKKGYLKRENLLTRVKIAVTKTRVIIDYRELFAYILNNKGEDVRKQYDDYIRAIEGMGNWLDGIEVNRIEKDVFEICFNE